MPLLLVAGVLGSPSFEACRKVTEQLKQCTVDKTAFGFVGLQVELQVIEAWPDYLAGRASLEGYEAIQTSKRVYSETLKSECLIFCGSTGYVGCNVDVLRSWTHRHFPAFNKKNLRNPLFSSLGENSNTTRSSVAQRLPTVLWHLVMSFAGPAATLLVLPGVSKEARFAARTNRAAKSIHFSALCRDYVWQRERVVSGRKDIERASVGTKSWRQERVNWGEWDLAVVGAVPVDEEDSTDSDEGDYSDRFLLTQNYV